MVSKQFIDYELIVATGGMLLEDKTRVTKLVDAMRPDWMKFPQYDCKFVKNMIQQFASVKNYR